MSSISEETYYFNKGDFDKDGYNKRTDKFFFSYVRQCEADFNNKYKFKYANYFFANSGTMYLMKRSMFSNEDIDVGMELIDGKINLDVNLEIEKYSKTEMFFELNSRVKGNEEESIYLFIDNRVADEEFILKYIDEDEDGDHETADIPAPEVGIELVDSDYSFN